MIPPRVLNTALMLAETPGRQGRNAEPALTVIHRLEEQGGWSFEPKWDGHRCRAVIDDGTVRLLSRSDRDVTDRHPRVTAALRDAFPPRKGGIVLDGELVCLGPDGRPDVHAVNRRGSQTVYVAFDVLFFDQDLRDEPYDVRMRQLDYLAERFDHVILQRTMTALDGAGLWGAVTDSGLEGIMAKRRDSRYVGRRSDAWLKIKVTQRVTALVTGIDHGTGSRQSTFGALHLEMVGDDGWVGVGKVGSGFTERDLADVCRHIATGRPLIIDVEFASVTRDRQLREPVFKGIREDLSPEDCALTQIGGGNTVAQT